MSNTHRLNELSFPDYCVTEMRIDHAARRALFEMTGAWIATGSLGGGELMICGWETLHQRRYDMAEKTWVDIPLGKEEPLKDIPELLVDGDQIVMRGFGAITGEWVELVAKGGKGEYRTRE